MIIYLGMLTDHQSDQTNEFQKILFVHSMNIYAPHRTIIEFATSLTLYASRSLLMHHVHKL